MFTLASCLLARLCVVVPAPGRLELGLKLYTRENQIKKLTKAGTLPNHQLGMEQPNKVATRANYHRESNDGSLIAESKDRELFLSDVRL